MAEPLTYEEVREWFDYNEKTGVLFWRKGNLAGKIANLKNGDGYQTVTLKRRTMPAHRVIWLWYYGYLPENFIDHINKKKNDNRIKNLREISHVCNLRNAKVCSINKSGIKGVGWHEGSNAWRARIKVHKKVRELGTTKDFDEAVCLRLAAEQCLDWPDCEEQSSAYLYVKKYIQDPLKDKSIMVNFAEPQWIEVITSDERVFYQQVTKIKYSQDGNVILYTTNNFEVVIDSERIESINQTSEAAIC